MTEDHVDVAQPGELYSFRFEAMNTTVSCTLAVASTAADCEKMRKEALSWFHYAEERFSRFRPSSELSQLNRTAGAHCLVSSAMLEVLQLAESYRNATEDAFNPFILDALLRCGYDKSFELLPASRKINPALAATAARSGRSGLGSRAGSSTGSGSDFSTPNATAANVKINPYMQSVKLPAGTSMDLGGIVKSWAVKRLAAWLQRKHGVTRGLVNAGGDLTVWGGGPRSPEYPWRVGIENPWSANRELGMLLLGEGASATSGTLGRRWETENGTNHHLIDPVTMLPASSDIVQCTTSGEDPVACEIWAKTLCILGSEAGLALLARAKAPIEALLFGSGGDIIFYGDTLSLGRKWLDVPISRTVTAFP